MNKDIDKKIEDIVKNNFNYYVNVFKELHQRPELSLCEYNTKKIIVRELKKIKNVKVYDDLTVKTAVLAVIQNKKQDNGCCLLRSEMDALPIDEKTNIKFKSKIKNIMHSCGHDGHMVSLLLTAKILSELHDDLKGTVKFLFQPGEEIGVGCKELILQDKILENKKVDFAIAIHNFPSFKKGMIVIPYDKAYGYRAKFKIRIIGKAGHGSFPDTSIDPIAILNVIYQNLQLIMTRKVDQTVARTLSVCYVNAGDENISNCIPERCNMGGTIRSYDYDVLLKTIKEIKKITTNMSKLYGAKISVEYNLGDAVVNDKKLANEFYEFLKSFYKNEVELDYRQHLGADNFSEIAKRVKSLYFFIGSKYNEFLHSDKYRFDTENIKISSSVLSKFILYKLNKF